MPGLSCRITCCSWILTTTVHCFDLTLTVTVTTNQRRNSRHSKMICLIGSPQNSFSDTTSKPLHKTRIYWLGPFLQPEIFLAIFEPFRWMIRVRDFVEAVLPLRPTINKAVGPTSDARPTALFSDGRRCPSLCLDFLKSGLHPIGQQLLPLH